MPISYTLDTARALIRVVWSGLVDERTLREHVQRLVLDPAARAYGRSVTDVRDAIITVDGTSIDALVRQLIAPGLGGQRWRIGFVVAAPVQFGLVRQFEAYADGTVSVRIFDDPADAERWVLTDSV